MTRSRSCSPCARPTRASKASPPSRATSRWTVRPRTPGASSRWPGPIRCRPSPRAPRLRSSEGWSPRIKCTVRMGSEISSVSWSPTDGPAIRSLRLPLRCATGPEVILDAADRWGAELTIVALGPLTNLALALQQDARRLGRVGRIVVMGGAIAVPGNTTPAAEFNFFVDPEAAAAVLEAGLPGSWSRSTSRAGWCWPRGCSRSGCSAAPTGSPASSWTSPCTASPSERSEKAGASCCTIRWRWRWPSIPPSSASRPFTSRSNARASSRAASRSPIGADPLAPQARVHLPGAMDVDAERVLGMVLERLCPVSA